MWNVFSYVDQVVGWRLIGKITGVTDETATATAIYNALTSHGLQLLHIKVEKITSPPSGIYPSF